MFSLRKIITQSVSPCAYRTWTKRSKLKVDPGIGRRKELLEIGDNEEIADFDDLDDLESDFMGVHKVHEEHIQELEYLKNKEKHYIVKQKYFKEKFPNFLTWHDKEQIRYLHKTDPEEWTVEKLSEGFPALPSVIQKIAKSQYVKTKQNKITNHDASVEENWKLFKEGRMSDLPKELVEHLNKFTNRALNLKPTILPDSQKAVTEIRNKTVNGEFSNIIRSYEKLKIKQLPETNQRINEHKVKDPPEGDTYYNSSETVRGRSVTLNQLHSKLSERAEKGKTIDEDEKLIVTTFKKEEHKKAATSQELVNLTPKKYPVSNELVSDSQKTPRDYSHLIYPEKIVIPKDIYKKGLTYKLNDCYYDDDGEFLYRVPGMG